MPFHVSMIHSYLSRSNFALGACETLVKPVESNTLYSLTRPVVQFELKHRTFLKSYFRYQQIFPHESLPKVCRSWLVFNDLKCTRFESFSVCQMHDATPFFIVLFLSQTRSRFEAKVKVSTRLMFYSFFDETYLQNSQWFVSLHVASMYSYRFRSHFLGQMSWLVCCSFWRATFVPMFSLYWGTLLKEKDWFWTLFFFSIWIFVQMFFWFRFFQPRFITMKTLSKLRTFSCPQQKLCGCLLHSTGVLYWWRAKFALRGSHANLRTYFVEIVTLAFSISRHWFGIPFAPCSTEPSALTWARRILASVSSRMAWWVFLSSYIQRICSKWEW